ncbi:squalene/phytoene synthase family protein [Caryophanon latum]|uniref:Phytoene synthase n=1 Tax=Caryophanon latum TaxID=33977 RepID=A0A1C0YTP2_9BACL|nr:squalene/phytoene synthase family protein [Caryophanon latum]OCS90511.1 phytoene synthase [Caryophanon latum]
MTTKQLHKEAFRVLKETSRTFYIPITFLKKDLKDAVAMSYLAMRALDEIEDDDTLSTDVKHDLLKEVEKMLLVRPFPNEDYLALLDPYKHLLPEVTLRMNDWLSLVPTEAYDIVKNATSEMAGGMAKWAKANWNVETREDLDDYTYYVAGLVGVLLADLFEWHNGEKSNRELAIGYGRGLQAVNIIRNEKEDMDERGVSFVPTGWTQADLFAYADENLANADEYMTTLNNKFILMFCKLPLALAHKSLKAIKEGREKMSRQEVEETVEEIKQQVQ